MEASNADGLERSSEGGLARLALAKPPRNLLDPDVMAALREAILEADADGDVQAIVLTGAGEMFCGGLDIERIQAGEDPVAFASALVELLRVLPTLGKPVIAAVNGDALASGYAIVCAADIAVTIDSARIGTFEASVGIWPMVAQIPPLQRLHPRHALENLLTGEPFDAAAVVDAVYEQIYRSLRPGVREHEVVADAQRLLFELGSEQVEAINAVSGDRCNPHPHVFSDRLLRPGDQAFFDIIHSFMGYRTCYYRTFNVGGVSQSQLDAYKQCREWLDAAIELVRPGVTTDQIAAVWPTAEELGFPDEEACFGLQFGHGLGVGLYEAPMISRLHSLEHPAVIEEGMVFALETYCAASDGRSAARIEEEVVVTADGVDILTKFPAEELLVTGKVYVRGADLLADSEARLQTS